MGCKRHRRSATKMSLGGDVAGGVLSGVGMGASFGPIGMAAGAVVGGVTSFFRSKKEQEAKERAERQRSLTQEAGDYFADLSSLQAFDNQFNAAFGVDMGISNFGTDRPGFDAEIEPTEVAEDVFRIEGPSHANGGVDVDANLDGHSEFELEGGEIVEDERVYSKRLKAPQGFIDLAKEEGFTLSRGSYAKVAEALGRMKDKYTDKVDSLDEAEANTGILMIDRIENLYDNLFYTQEFSKLNKQR